MSLGKLVFVSSNLIQQWFPSLKQAARATGVGPDVIRKICVRKSSRIVNGNQFSYTNYLDENLPNNECINNLNTKITHAHVYHIDEVLVARKIFCLSR